MAYRMGSTYVIVMMPMNGHDLSNPTVFLPDAVSRSGLAFEIISKALQPYLRFLLPQHIYQDYQDLFEEEKQVDRSLIWESG